MNNQNKHLDFTSSDLFIDFAAGKIAAYEALISFSLIV
jgi:hypothetical protein